MKFVAGSWVSLTSDLLLSDFFWTIYFLMEAQENKCQISQELWKRR